MKTKNLNDSIKVYEPTGRYTVITVGELLDGGMTPDQLEQIIRLERWGDEHYAPVHEAADRARAAGATEEQIQAVFDAHANT